MAISLSGGVAAGSSFVLLPAQEAVVSLVVDCEALHKSGCDQDFVGWLL